MGSRRISEEEKKYIIEAYLLNNTTPFEIASNLNISITTVRFYLKKHLGDLYKPNLYNKSVVFNEKIFQTITQETAYWGGFLYADGAIQQTGALRLKISQKDYVHLLKYCQFLGLDEKYVQKVEPTTSILKNGRVIKGNTVCSVSISRKQFLEDLKIFGVTPNKTYAKIFTPNIPLEYLPDYLRGWIDGDGSVVCHKRSDYEGNRYAISVVGNKPSLDWFVGSIQKLGYTGHITWSLDKRHLTDYNHETWKIIFNGINQCLQVYNLVKAFSSLRLDRKWHILDNLEFVQERDINLKNLFFNNGAWELKMHRYNKAYHIGRFTSLELAQEERNRWENLTDIEFKEQIELLQFAKQEKHASKYKGVTFHKKCNLWIAEINIDKKRVFHKYFHTEIQAAHAINQFILQNNLDRPLNDLSNINESLTDTLEEANLRLKNKLIKRKSNAKKESSKYYGVTYDKKREKFIAQTTANKKNCHIGRYKTEIEAAKAYNKFVIENNLNRPLNDIPTE